jgi:hypothetical protein
MIYMAETKAEIGWQHFFKLVLAGIRKILLLNTLDTIPKKGYS